MDVSLLVDEKVTKTHSVRSIPERPERISSILKKLTVSGTLEQLERPTTDAASDRDILRSHSFSYLSDLRRSCAEGSPVISYSPAREPLDPRSRALADLYGRWSKPVPDPAIALESIRSSESVNTPITHSSCEGALISAGTVLSAIESVRNGGPRRAFCITRPPGHHAEYDTAMGFCFFNNICVGARYLLEQLNVKRLAIVDFDVHHGNGSQHQFYDDPRVLVYNIHRSACGFYPYFCGHRDEIGSGAGIGYNVNDPLKEGSGPEEYRVAFDALVRRLAEFKPEWLLISAGFDAHKRDPLGGMCLSSTDYTTFARRLAEVADSFCGGRMISVLEGGYNLDALSACVDAYLTGLLQS